MCRCSRRWRRGATQQWSGKPSGLAAFLLREACSRQLNRCLQPRRVFGQDVRLEGTDLVEGKRGAKLREGPPHDGEGVADLDVFLHVDL